MEKTPAILTALEALVAPETAGDPMSTQKWVRSSLRRLSDRLKQAGHTLSPPTVGRLLRKLEYSPHVNSKQLEARSNHADRDVQFAHIDEQIATFRAAGQPIISVDSKKKELIGEFRQAGRSWSLEPLAVNIHDFLGDSLGRAAPYGIYDVLNNRGTVYVGKSADTPAFAVDVIADWWQCTGRVTFPMAKELLILADAGGSNRCIECSRLSVAARMRRCVGLWERQESPRPEPPTRPNGAPGTTPWGVVTLPVERPYWRHALECAMQRSCSHLEVHTGQHRRDVRFGGQRVLEPRTCQSSRPSS